MFKRRKVLWLTEPPIFEHDLPLAGRPLADLDEGHPVEVLEMARRRVAMASKILT